MAVTVKKIELWRKEISNRPGTLAQSLKPLAEAGVDLQVVMGYVIPGNNSHAAVEVYPITSSKAESAAKAAGLKPGSLSCLLVEGDNKSGLAHKVSKALADASINMNFAVIQVIGGKYTGIFGFNSMRDALAATPVIKNAAAVSKGKAKAGGKKTSSKKAAKKKPSGKVIKITAGKKLKGKSAAKAAMRKTGSKKKSSGKKKRK